MIDKNKEFVELMLKKSKETPTEAKYLFSNLDPKEVETLTKQIMDKKPNKKV
ncbi:MAG: hypothetical protein KKG75_04695 [Nanoarchaeota archaeon]|nr:hypothetical protein [Nanoarchaeota archaeon]